MSETKTFAGKQYLFRKAFKLKSEANQYAKGLRSKGLLVRIHHVKRIGTLDRSKYVNRYNVYVNDKSY